ncbi:MAG: alpha/beta hydrolase [Firmicutes bacterium]|nr:alpha/beta hydrolase [Bacillota bacterium]
MTTQENEAKIMSMYEAKLATWPVPYEEGYVKTRYGTTHVIMSGPKEAPPLVLVHAMGVTSTMWLPNIAALSREYRVYAVDTIGDFGKSALDNLDRYPRNGREYSLWLTDVFDQLSIQKADIIGASMGGWITMNYAIYAPDRVNRIALLGPLGIRSSFQVLFRLMSVVLFPVQANKRSLIQWTLGDNPRARDAYTEYMLTAVNCRNRLGTPYAISGDNLRRIKAPVLLVLGGSDNPIGSAEKAAARAEKLIPDIQVEIMPKTGHLMNMEDPEFVNAAILKFLYQSAHGNS